MRILVDWSRLVHHLGQRVHICEIVLLVVALARFLARLFLLSLSAFLSVARRPAQIRGVLLGIGTVAVRRAQ